MKNYNLIPTASKSKLKIPHCIHAISYTISKDDYNIAGTPMQFNITVSLSASPFEYRFDLEENVTNSSISLDDDSRVSHSFIFPTTTKPGIYRLKVAVYFMFGFKITRIYGTSHIDFEIKDKLNGTIKYTQENLRQSAYSNSYVSCFNQINFVSQIDDFHKFYKSVTYNWFINGTQVPNITGNQLNYTMSKEDTYNITTTFNATSISNLTFPGRNELKVIAFKPLDSLNLTGIPNISWKRNRGLEIYVNFVNGTKPFWYCYQIFTEESFKLNCNDPDNTVEDYFKVTKRFSRNGTYYLKIKAGNMVTKVEKSFPITVIDFEKKSQMIIIIMPIAAFILILLIVLSSVLFFMKKRVRFETEVADFNFEAKAQMDLLSAETFFQRLKNTFRKSIKDVCSRHKETQFKQLESVNDDSTDDT